jgi:hypothetical protein
MKVTSKSNLLFLLCISTVVMPAIDARANGFGLKRSAATKRSIEQRQGVFDFAAHQESHRDLKSPATKRSIEHRKAFDVHQHLQRRSLQTDGDLENVALDLCEAFLSILLGPDSDCTCAADGVPTSECDTYISENCKICDTLQGEEACILFGQAETTAVNATDGSVDCFSYESGPFVGTTICEIEDVTNNTCAITIDGEECSSCTVIACGDDTDYEFDCSNIIEGETWNLCTSDIPETSRFLAGGNNERFTQLDCGYGGLGLALCQSFLDDQFGADSDCACEQNGQDFIPSCDCAFQFCETLQGEEVCGVIDEEAAAAATASASESSIFADCYTFRSGPLDNTICTLDNLAESTCAITIDGTECNSCALASCSATDGAGVFGESFDFDCSNVIAGETWNLCTDDIPETSPFIVIGNNELFIDGSCVPGSGGFAVSFHALSMVGLMVVATFW